MFHFLRLLLAFAVLLVALALPPGVRGEAVLQYFNTSWKEIERRIPEVAEAGYTSLWLPQPAKGASGAYSVGYDPLDRFDLGDKNQSGTVATRYGTKAELLRMVEMAHRFGLRVYFDNVMAHNAGPLDAVAVHTLFPGMPGFVPEDFHLVSKPGGGWKKASDSINYSDEWQVLNRNPFAWDIAQESPNVSFDPRGQTEGLSYPKWSGIRHPGQTALYPDNDLAGVTDANGEIFHPFADKEPYQDIGTVAHPEWAGNGKFDFEDLNGNGQHDPGEPSEPFTDRGVDPTNPAHQNAAWGWGDGRYNMGDPVAEDVNAMLLRAIRWTIDQTHCDGFRLDAVKHVPSYFFGQQSGTKDPSSAGYLGRAQAQFNLTHGYSDWSNHRNSNYSTNATRDDLMFFGEHLGAPPNPNDYLAAGMRIANDDFVNNVGGFNGIGANMTGYDNPGQFTFGVDAGVMYCLSHDNNYMAGSERPAAHQYMLTRAGVPVVYTDGYNISGVPDYFPKPAYIPFLGEYGQTYVTGALPLRRDFIRGDQIARWSTQNYCAWEFRDFSENAGMSAADATTLVVMHARNYVGGQQMPFTTTFPANMRLKNYSPSNGAFYVTVGNDGFLRGDGDPNPVIVPSGGYFAFSYDTPELPNLWPSSSTVHPIDIFESGVQVPTIGVLRKDGANGDPAYNYTAQIPLVRDATNLRLVARADASAEDILMALDGGADLNSQMGAGFIAGRDNVPGTATDTFLGFEKMRLLTRQYGEKFAAVDTTRNKFASPGAETYLTTIGSNAFTVVNGPAGANDYSTDGGLNASFLYHDPAANVGGMASPPKQYAETSGGITIWGKPNSVGVGWRAWIYYTNDGTNPEGAGGLGLGTTKAVAMHFDHSEGTPNAGDWWTGSITPKPAGQLRYKLAIYKDTTNGTTPVASVFPGDAAAVTRKKRGLTTFEITAFNATTCTVFPHNDLGVRQTGLSEGFHVLRTRAFLSHSGKASIFKTNTQTFYYDAQRPAGQVSFPTESATIGGSTYGFVVLTDASVNGVQFNILDTNAGNDSAANGNGTGNWTAATEVTPSQLGTTGYVREWRFDFKNIPTSGAAIVNVRLREASSSADNALDDATGWFTTLTRNVNTGYAVNYRIQFPTTDGTVVDTSYVAKVYFDKSLGFISGVAVPAAQMVGEFTITLDGTLLPRAGYTFIANETASDSALSFHFPNFYTGNPDDLHEVRATWQRGNISLTDIRDVKAAPGAILDSDGDGLPDYWEIANRLDPNNPDGDNGAYGDKDGDGIPNILEFLGDFNPADPNDGTLLRPIISPNGATWRLQFPVIPNRRYQIETSANLTTWGNTGASFTVPTANPMYLWPDPAPTSAPRFYRVRISLP